MAQQYRSSRSRGNSGRSGGSSRGGSARGGSGRSGGSSRGGSRPAGRGGSRPPARGGGGNGAMVAAVLVVVGVIGLVVFLTAGKGKQDDGPNRASTNPTPHATHPGTSTPAAPTPPPYPELSMDLKRRAMEVANKAKELSAQGNAVYDEAMTARREGDDDLWQEKLAEANEYFYEIRELWNDLVAEMPASEHYDEEEIANHFLGREGSIVSNALSRLTDIKKQRRL